MRILILSLIFSLFLPLIAGAQDAAAPTRPDFNAQMLETQSKALDNNVELSEDQRAQGKTFYTNAKDRLDEAAKQVQRRAQYEATVTDIISARQALGAELEAARATLATPMEPMGEMIGEDALIALERDLIAKESALSAIETRLSSLETELQSLALRQVTAPKELAEARERLGEVTTALAQLGEGDLEPVSEARRISLEARQWFRRNQIQTLEAEIATLPVRQELVTTRRTLADLQAQDVRKRVLRLADRTGQKRLNEAEALRERMSVRAQLLSTEHPIIASFAADNLKLAREITEFAALETVASKTTAAVRGQQVIVKNDLTAARELVSLGRLDREAGATLRRLGNQLEPTASIRQNMRLTQDSLSDATRQRVIAQEQLRDLPLGQFDMEAALATIRQEMPNVPELTDEQRGTLETVLDSRRDLLRQITSQATSRINDIAQLQSAQSELLQQTEDLQTLLDENLLWVRSIPAMDLSFPRKAALGAVELFSIPNLRLAFVTLTTQAQRLWIVVLIFVVAIFFIWRTRPRVRADIDRRATLVGRVKQDSAWNTPAVILSGIFNALPFPLIFALIGILFEASPSPNRVIEGLADGFLYLSLFALIFLTWVRWDRDKSLFAAHFKMPEGLRRTVGRNLRWFVPFAGTTSTLVAITTTIPSENIYEGFAPLMFLLTAVALAVFSARILWTKQAQISSLVPAETALTRFRGPISALIVGLPLASAGLAIFGYFESAEELLWRLFITGWLILGAYVVYGAVRRAIVVAQRQIKYRQALERREKELAARREKMAAEERGEDVTAPPPVDTNEIDVTTMTRQTSQLLRTATFLTLAALLWMNWAGLFPALSIFDGFEVWSYNTGETDEVGAAVLQAVSLWDILQSLVIFALTFIAAKNLPGFLEIFVLNRMGVDPGTRYAVTTIVGYIIIAVGVIIAFNELGLQWSQLKWVATGLSVGIGFGLQKIIANFVSGLIILFERPIRIGDYVTIGDQSGTVARIKIRATTLKDLDNLEILIPNEALVSERVTNWTLSSSVTRLIVNVGIAYGSDTDRARDLMLEAIKAIPKVLDNPPPQVLFMGFGDSSLDFEIRVFLRNFDDRVPMKHAIHTEINKVLASAGISIPFPQRDLNIVSAEVPIQIAQMAAKTPRKKP